ncbi:hypothetical protein BDV23DRAFT_158434 [Aspergillus alliaceus]|uniref:HNH nuclease domain-containing protein n=1 Tax=Petromyces alliaceus TaxID=209559 RepID=A0A5N7C3W8_PETAA|nr:hypothetical protein BDV23DRAFT_158434 [Aspergillus alliaceus]
MISEQSPSRTQSSVRSSQSSSTFSPSIQLRVKQMDGDRCWACHSESPQICHVFAQEDRQAPLWEELGLIDFAINSDTNAIPLCPTCHNQFDCALDPGFIFIPTDLPYFIEFELKDRQRRKIQADSGVISKRAVPTPEMYKRYQIDKGIIALDAIGGQYLPFFLKHYLLPDLPFDVSQYYSKPKEWHGAPLASIRRCLLVLGSARLRSLPVQTRLELEKLRNLYFLDNEGDSPPLDNNFLNAVTQTPSDNKGKKRKLDNTTPDKPPSPKKQQDAQQGEDGHSYNKGATTFCPILQKEVPAYWSLGPDVSTEEAVCRFAPVLAQSPESVL